jgi:hypothetical protein
LRNLKNNNVRKQTKKFEKKKKAIKVFLKIKKIKLQNTLFNLLNYFTLTQVEEPSASNGLFWPRYRRLFGVCSLHHREAKLNWLGFGLENIFKKRETS